MSEKDPMVILNESVKLQEKSVELQIKNQPTLRDLFAMAALQGLLANDDCVFESIEEQAYLHADQMLEQRKKKSFLA
jgi:hypothetical protein